MSVDMNANAAALAADQPVNPSPVAPTGATLTIVPAGPSAFDHAALLLGALVLVAAAIFDSYHSLSAVEWGVIGVAVAALGVKGTLGIPQP